MSLFNFLRPASILAGFALLITTAAVHPVQAAVIPTVTYEFSGTCTDCTGTALATLVLQNYTPGDAISDPDQLVSFTYYPTDLFPTGFTILNGDPTLSIGGSVPNGDGPADFYINNDSFFFYTGAFTTGDLSGYTGPDAFETGVQAPAVLLDYGTSSSFSLQSVATPEPSSFLLIGGGLASLVALRRRKK
jgi:hypothetical protein